MVDQNTPNETTETAINEPAGSEPAGNVAETSPVTGGNAGAPSPKRSGRRGIIALVVVAVVVVVAGVGLWVWHEQPSFCGAICHTPMDNYLATYETPLGQATTDKWGNPVEDSSTMLAAVHAAQGDTCMDCHIPTLGEQISEGATWVSGSYEFPLIERDASDLTEASGRTADEFCINEACHSTLTREQLVEETADMGIYNPHEAHHMELECTTCHKAHRSSVMYCTQCHAQAVVPDGWIRMGESNELTGVKAAE